MPMINASEQFRRLKTRRFTFCRLAKRFCADKTLGQAWRECDDAGWMLWWLVKFRSIEENVLLDAVGDLTCSLLYTGYPFPLSGHVADRLRATFNSDGSRRQR